MSETVNLYKVLNLSRDCTEKDIKKAYKKLVIKYHPDRGGDEELFEIVTNAYNILINPDSRKQYDKLYQQSVSTKNNYMDMKAQSTAFLDGQNKTASKEDHVSFEKAWDDLNKKHGYYEESKEEIVISQDTANKTMLQMMTNRKQHEEEDKPELLFEPGAKFDPIKFNAAFDAANGNPLDLVEKKDVPDAWNGPDSAMTTYSSFEKLEELYDEENDVNNLHGVKFGSVNFASKTQKKLTKKDMESVGTADYVTGHNKIDKDYYDQIKERLKERSMQSNTFDSKKMTDYDKNDTAGYGIFDKLGIKFDEKLNISDWDNKNVNAAYQKLLAERAKLGN